jgi:tubulin---tyrosine ligase
MAHKTPLTAIVDWPTAPLTNSLVLNALSTLRSTARIVQQSPLSSPNLSENILQWSTYDSLDHTLTLTNALSVLSSSYTFRKCLIRKHFLARTIRSYVAKYPSSSLASAVPRSWEIDITFADELDEMWMDDLYDLGQFLDADEAQWCILKPGMADRGMGIRLFRSREALQRIYEEFEDEQTDDEADSTAVATSQLRHFVIQVNLCGIIS